MATKFSNKARTLEDEVNDGRKHCGQLPTKTYQIYNSSLFVCLKFVCSSAFIHIV